MKTWTIKFVGRQGQEYISRIKGEREDALKIIEDLLMEYKKDLLEGRIISVE